MNDLPTMPEFEAHLNEQFMVTLSDRSLYPLTLVEVSPLPHHDAPRARRDPFQVKFRGPGPGYLPQQMHEMHNTSLGECSLFLVPIGREGDGFVYQAVFN
jgi:hypothetical protein